MCVTCEHMLYEEHRSAEMEGKIRRCRKCKKFPSNSDKSLLRRPGRTSVEPGVSRHQGGD